MAKSRIHQAKEGRCAFFTNPSKFEKSNNTTVSTEEALAEGNALRKKLSGHRILVDVRPESEPCACKYYTDHCTCEDGGIKDSNWYGGNEDAL